jgi:hypothetical protein
MRRLRRKWTLPGNCQRRDDCYHEPRYARPRLLASGDPSSSRGEYPESPPWQHPQTHAHAAIRASAHADGRAVRATTSAPRVAGRACRPAVMVDVRVIFLTAGGFRPAQTPGVHATRKRRALPLQRTSPATRRLRIAEQRSDSVADQVVDVSDPPWAHRHQPGEHHLDTRPTKKPDIRDDREERDPPRRTTTTRNEGIGSSTRPDHPRRRTRPRFRAATPEPCSAPQLDGTGSRSRAASASGLDGRKPFQAQ